VELGIAEITRARVRRAAEELGYRSDTTQSRRIVGFVSDAITSEPYAGEMIRGALAAALAHDHLLVIADTDGDSRTEDDLLRGMVGRQVSGSCTARCYGP
jgi:LacI family transcriptional regulator